MRKLLNTLFITSEDAYASLDGENIVLNREQKEFARVPLHNLESIFSFSYAGASPALVGKCLKEGILFSFFTPRGRFLYRSAGITQGNVLLRREQYRIADDERRSLGIGRNFIIGKIYNARERILRIIRDHPYSIDEQKFSFVANELKIYLRKIVSISSIDDLRGMEGAAAVLYFSCFDSMILASKEDFYFHGRSRRPPLDNVNALLSFVYVLLSLDCVSALEAVGLDAAVGFIHTDRPGRKSLALDLMEEFRPCIADRFVLRLINNRILKKDDFLRQETGAVLLKPEARKVLFQYWQQQKKEVVIHPYLEEKVERGLLPYIQALLLARYIRGDIDGYPPFLWKG